MCAVLTRGYEVAGNCQITQFCKTAFFAAPIRRLTREIRVNQERRAQYPRALRVT